jgi:chromosome transmission fidelity protein 1
LFIFVGCKYTIIERYTHTKINLLCYILQGKSLSLICGALKWLKDHEEREKRELTNHLSELKISETADDGDWLSAQSKNIEKERARLQVQANLDKINKKNEKIKKIRESYRDKVSFIDITGV